MLEQFIEKGFRQDSIQIIATANQICAEPRVLTALIQDELEGLIDRAAMDAVLAHEAETEARLQEIADRYDDLDGRWDEILDVIG